MDRKYENPKKHSQNSDISVAQVLATICDRVAADSKKERKTEKRMAENDRQLSGRH